VEKTSLIFVLETDFKESMELITPNMLLMIFLTGILPTALTSRIDVIYPRKISQLLKCLASIIICAITIIILVFFEFKTFASVFRNHREIIHMMIPNNFINAIYQNVILLYPDKKEDFISSAAIKDDGWKNHQRRSVFVFVVGETARAENFSLNGYARDTNPKLKSLDVINYSNVYSCGTSTAASLPCIFSSLDRANITKDRIRYSDNLMKLIKDAGIEVLWIDNNSGCKGVCDPKTTIETEKVFQDKAGQEIYDASMLEVFEDYIAKNQNKDLFIVLHQKGSHGPAYYLRTPESFYHFKPICTTAELQQCTSQSIVNSYDNTILYTDYFLAKLISSLKKKKDVNTAMLYVSDHGESLGENGIYLHGMPYMIAPKNQKHVPMIMWLSDNYLNDFRIDKDCVSQQQNHPLSHDNIFHSILDALRIKTNPLDNNLSIFHKCIQ
jgi:lipid A ethanolaminephosphotransferase